MYNDYAKEEEMYIANKAYVFNDGLGDDSSIFQTKPGQLYPENLMKMVLKEAEK